MGSKLNIQPKHNDPKDPDRLTIVTERCIKHMYRLQETNFNDYENIEGNGNPCLK